MTFLPVLPVTQEGKIQRASLLKLHTHTSKYILLPSFESLLVSWCSYLASSILFYSKIRINSLISAMILLAASFCLLSGAIFEQANNLTVRQAQTHTHPQRHTRICLLGNSCLYQLYESPPTQHTQGYITRQLKKISVESLSCLKDILGFLLSSHHWVSLTHRKAICFLLICPIKQKLLT